MLKNRWLLVSVAFCVSFVLSLLLSQGIKAAFLAALIAVPASYCGTIAVNWQQRIRRKRVVTALEVEIRQLENWGVQLYDYLELMAAEQERTEIQISFLKRQLNQLYVQTGEQQKYKQQLDRELVSLSEQRRLLEEEVHQWETQLYHLEQQKEELDLSLRSLLAEKHKIESDIQHLQVQTVEPQIETTQTETDAEPSATIPDEWTEFVAQLTNSELQVLKAIVELENPNAEIKKIAESYITMPELLIDAINERAIATIGDIIIEQGSLFPVISETEYLANMREILKLKK
ncbi:tellurite resistance TerB C-terminal domain-containing protein [Aerosakkonema funiforme]|uniref:tellurite resistance TerB C-terminal domain-containing protein n=1 Tax=Aerosakkonema funiforme TaxID=1246630 RepID=UPI0035B81973